MAGPPTDPPADLPTDLPGPPGRPPGLPGRPGVPGLPGRPGLSHGDPTGTPGGMVCPDCGGHLDGRFCEGCGFDLKVPVVPHRPAAFTGRDVTLPSVRAPLHAAQVRRTEQAQPEQPQTEQPPPRATSLPVKPNWIAEIDADRAYFEATTGDDRDSLVFPSDYPRRQVPLNPPEVRIGRRSPSRGLEPEIDLSGPQADPGISHLHAVLLAEPDGGWQLIDPGSTNGTTLNDGTGPLATNVAVPVADGDRIHLGAWTTITIRAVKAGSG